jgi:hypothetical protein
MDYATEFVNQFCTQLAIRDKGLRNMHAFYLWGDKRDGTVQERFEMDARDYFEYQKIFTV